MAPPDMHGRQRAPRDVQSSKARFLFRGPDDTRWDANNCVRGGRERSIGMSTLPEKHRGAGIRRSLLWAGAQEPSHHDFAGTQLEIDSLLEPMLACDRHCDVIYDTSVRHDVM